MFYWGIALVFMTSPFLPPWWRWMFLLGGDVTSSDDLRGLPKK